MCADRCGHGCAPACEIYLSRSKTAGVTETHRTEGHKPYAICFSSAQAAARRDRPQAETRRSPAKAGLRTCRVRRGYPAAAAGAGLRPTLFSWTREVTAELKHCKPVVS